MPDKSPQIFLDIVTFFTSKPVIGILSFLAGIATAIIPQWNQWLIKKRELTLTNQFNSRKETIHRWRDEIDKHTSYIVFMRTSTYRELVGYLPKREEQSKTAAGLPLMTRDQELLSRFHDIVSQKEKEWGII